MAAQHAHDKLNRMSSVLAKQDIKKLTVNQRLRLIALIWDTLDNEKTDVPVSEQTLVEMERRAAELEAHPERAISHQEMKARLRRLK